MGMNQSQENSNMNGSDQEGDSSESSDLSFASRNQGEGDEEPDLPSIVAFLIRSGQIRFISNDATSGNSDSDEGSSGGLDEPKCKPAPVDKYPDTSTLKKNDLHSLIMQSSGLRADPRWTYYLRPSFLNQIAKREVGLNQQKNFTHGEKCVLSSRFLPNKMSVLACYKHKAFCGSYSTDGDMFVSACQDQMIRVYDTRNERFELLKSIRAKDVGWSVLDTAFSPDGLYAAYSSWSDCIHICNLYGDHEAHEALPLMPGDYSFCIFSLKFSSDNKEILGGANDGHLYVYDRESNKRSLKIDAHDDDVNSVCFADDSSQILYSGGDDGLCKVWDRRTLREESPTPVGVLAGHSDGITYIDSKGDARFFISNSKDQTMRLWDVRYFSDQTGIEESRRAVSSQRWDYRWQQVPKRLSRKINLKGDSSVMTYRGHRILNTLIRCKFSPVESTGQRYLYTGCASGSAIVYDILTGEMVSKLEGHSSCVRDVSWHPYNNTIVTSSWDGSLGNWYYSPERDFVESGSGSKSEGRLRSKRWRNRLR